MVPIFSQFDYERIRAEREQAMQQAALRKLARDTRRNRENSSRGMWLSRILSVARAHFQRSSRPLTVREPLHASGCECRSVEA